MKKYMYSGGAKGADYLFNEFALQHGFTPINYTFNKHKYVTETKYNIMLNNDYLNDNIITNALKKANTSLDRSIPPKGSYVYNLLARNFYQILNTNAVYAISNLVSPSRISGGTAWATQMYIDLCINENSVLNLYLYDLISECVFYFDLEQYRFIVCDYIPFPNDSFTGIGSRDTTKNDFIKFTSFLK